MAAANGKPELGQSGECELARLAASLVRARVSSANARTWVAKTWFAARLREAGYVRGRCEVGEGGKRQSQARAASPTHTNVSVERERASALSIA